MYFLLFLGLLVISWSIVRIRRSIWVYFAFIMVFLSVSHGPYDFGLWSMSRYVVTIFPGFLVIGALLEIAPRTKWIIWPLSAAALVFSVGWFATGRWVA